MPSIYTLPASYAPPSPTLTNPDMILPALKDAPESPTTPTQRQRPPSLSGIQERAQSDDRALDSKRLPNVTSFGPHIERIRTKGRRSFGESLGNDDGRSELRKGTRSVKIRLNGASSSSSSSPVDSIDSRFNSRAHPPTSGYDEPLGNESKDRDGTNEDSTGGTEEQQGALDSNEDDYGFSQTVPKHIDGIITTVERGDPYSHAAKSIRAEQILQNAKRRLTAMEGNLNRARSRLGGRPSSSMSSFIEEDDESEPINKGILVARRREITSPAKHRQNHAQSTTNDNKGHLRVFSETSVPSSLQSPSREDFQGLNGTGEGAKEESADGEPQGWHWGSQSYGSRHQNPLPALNEDEVPLAFDSSPLGSPDSELSGPNFGDQRQPSRSPGTRNLLGGSLTRARSTTQMRDLRDQMQDLKGKISNLKQRAREDSLKRRSMQSLRTSSPFTNAEDWYLGAPDHRGEQAQAAKELEIQEESRREQQQPRTLPQQSPSPPSKHKEILDSRNMGPIVEKGLPESFTTHTPPPEQIPLPKGKDSPTDLQNPLVSPSSEPLTLTDGDNSNDQYQIAEIEDSLYGDHDYHETSPHPVSSELSHEDRADAFDYEHFILHSAMGSIGGQKLSRSSSHSSMYSVETTKPTANGNGIDDERSTSSPQERFNDDDDISPKTIISSKKVPAPTIEAGKKSQHARNISVESISTDATFATATEGGSSKVGSDDADDRPFGANREHHWNANIPPSRQFPIPDHVPQQATKQRISRAPAPPSIITAHPHHRHTNSAGASPSTMSAGETTPLPRRTQSLKHKRVGSVKSNQHDNTSPNQSLTADTPTILSLLSALATPSSRNHSSSLSASKTPPPPTSIFSQDSQPQQSQEINLSLADTDLVYRLVTSLAKVCKNLHTDGAVGERGRGRQWRRRLDGARRVLDGEVNGEVF